MKKYKLNETIYFINGKKIVKAFVIERIEHYTQTVPIFKYIVRPYGMKDTVTIDAKIVKTNLEELKKELINNIKNQYSKPNIIKSFENAKKELETKRKEALDNFDEAFSDVIVKVTNTTEKDFDDMEKEYQATIKIEEKK